MLSKEEFRYRNFELKWRSIHDEPLFKKSTRKELHHIHGHKNSYITVPLSANRHEFINRRVNKVSRRLRENPTISFLTNAIGATDLMGYELRHVLFLIQKEPCEKRLEEICNKRGIDHSQIAPTIKQLMEAIK